METENTQFMRKNNIIFSRINRKIERVRKAWQESTGIRKVISSITVSTVRIPSYYIKRVGSWAYEDTFNGEHRVYNHYAQWFPYF